MPAPPPIPPVTWSERGLATGTRAPTPPSPLDRLLGGLLLLAWRALGLLLLPWLMLHPRARRHVIGLPAPEPGWTWLHGASAGEHSAARALAAVLHEPAWRTRTPRTLDLEVLPLECRPPPSRAERRPPAGDP